MPTTPWISVVKQVANGEQVSAEVVNPILQQLVNRDQHLYEKFAVLDNKSVLLTFDLKVNPTATVNAGTVVFYDTVNGLDLAKIGFSSNAGGTVFTPLDDSFVCGVVKAISTVGGSRTADLFLQGLLEKEGIVATLMQTGEPATLGPLYLSKTQPGKLTANPGGINIYVGYALTPNKFYLNPHTEALNQFFFNYKFNILDRPACNLVVQDNTWASTQTDLTVVGWVPVTSLPAAIQSLSPQSTSWFYNVPTVANVENDSALSAAEKAEADALRAALPPYPAHYTTLTVNGLVQKAHDSNNTDGKYVINNVGLWWIGSIDGTQPWSSDILNTVNLTSDASTATFSTGTTTNPLINGDKIRLTGDTLPSSFNASTDYYVVLTDGNQFQLTASVGGTTVDFSGVSTNLKVAYTPNLWKYFKGQDFTRPRIGLQFVKLNPEYQLTTVTSLKSASPAVKLVTAENGNVEGSVGNLILKLNIPTAAVNAVATVAQSVKKVSFDNATGKLDVNYQKTITDVKQGTGIVVSVNTVGEATISAASANFSGGVSQIEPENASLETLGLHYYTNLTDPSETVANGLVGKFLLPDNLPSQDLLFTLHLFGKLDTNNGKVSFKFEYALTTPNTLITDVVTAGSQIDVVFPVGYVAKTCFTVSPSQFIIPAARLKNNAYVNFRLARLDSTYTADVGVIGVSWKIS